MSAILSTSAEPSGSSLSLSRVMAVEGREFIADAYRFALGREPDAEGVEYYVRRLRHGATKREILAQLYLSPEARVGGRSVAVLTRLSLPYRLRKLPLLGLLFELLFLLQRALEAPRHARAAASTLFLVNEELHARIQAMENRLVALPWGGGQATHVGREAAPAAVQPPEPRLAGGAEATERLKVEDLLDISRQVTRGAEEK